MAQFSVKIMRLNGSVLGANQHRSGFECSVFLTCCSPLVWRKAIRKWVSRQRRYQGSDATLTVIPPEAIQHVRAELMLAIGSAMAPLKDPTRAGLALKDGSLRGAEPTRDSAVRVSRQSRWIGSQIRRVTWLSRATLAVCQPLSAGD